MVAQPPNSLRCARGLEDTLAALDAQLADAEKQAANLLKAVRRLRRAAKEGMVASLPAAHRQPRRLMLIGPVSRSPRPPRRSAMMSPMHSPTVPGSMNWPLRPRPPAWCWYGGMGG